MKNLVLVLVFVLFGSFAFATSESDKINANVDQISTEIQEEAGPFVCYEISRSETTNPMNGEVTITIVYRCVDLSQFY